MYWTIYTIVFLILIALNIYSMFNKQVAKTYLLMSLEDSWIESFYGYIVTGNRYNVTIIGIAAMGVFSFIIFTMAAIILSLAWPIVIIIAIAYYVVFKKEAKLKKEVEQRENTYSKTKSTEEENFFIN